LEEEIERGTEFACDLPVVGDEELLEEGLVDQSANLWRRGDVGVVEIGGERKGILEVSLDDVCYRMSRLQDAIGRSGSSDFVPDVRPRAGIGACPRFGRGSRGLRLALGYDARAQRGCIKGLSR
jgi:hypothetical protein